MNIAPKNQNIKLHFTIDKEHRKTFETLAELFLNSKQASLEISYSYQHPLTDTPVLDHENKWVRDEQDQLLFRKGGHGALLENLNQMNTNFVWLKNIDNIQIGYYSEAIRKILKIPYLSKIKYGVVFCDTWENPKNSKLLPQIKNLSLIHI